MRRSQWFLHHNGTRMGSSSACARIRVRIRVGGVVSVGIGVARTYCCIRKRELDLQIRI